MNYIYKENEFEYARYIKSNSPIKIWCDGSAYVFDYGDFYFEIGWLSEPASTQNESDEVIIAPFTKYVSGYKPQRDSKLICENEKINEVHVVRVFIYFSTYREFTSEEQSDLKAKQEEKALLSGEKDAWGDILSNAIGSSEEFSCHPKSEEANKIHPKYSNLIDCGLLIKINDRYLKVFLEGNGPGFHSYQDKYFYDLDEVKDLPKKYELIEVN